LNDALLSSPTIQNTIQGGGVGITGDWSEEEARELAYQFELAVASAGTSGN
jgi:preprotein translocase subunit SecD